MSLNIPNSPKELKKKILLELRYHIRENNYKELNSLLPVAKELSIPVSLQVEGWLSIANFKQNKGKHVSALLAFSSARALQPNNEKIWIPMVRSFRSFYDTFEREFSHEDLIIFSDPIGRLLEYRKINQIAHGSPFHELKRLKTDVDDRIRVAKSAKKTKVSHCAVEIFNAFRHDMTMPEVNDELARIILPAVMEWLRENPSEGAKSKKNTPIKATPPPPKDPDDPHQPPNEGDEAPKEGEGGTN